MLKIKLKNSDEYEVLTQTAVYPSGSPALRSRMEIHMAADAMGLEDFAALFGDTQQTAELHLVNTETGSDVTYKNYSLVSSVGKQRVDETDYTTGTSTSSLQLVVVLEQLTYIEQQLAALGVEIK